MSRMNRMMAKGARMQAVLAPTLWNARKRVWKHIDETRPLVEPPQAGRWAVLQVAPRMEAKAADALRDAGYHAWYPQTIRTETKPALFIRRKFNEPLFVRYVFAAPGSVVERRSWPDRHTSRQIASEAVSESRRLFSDWMRSPQAVGMVDCDHVSRIVAHVPYDLLANLAKRQTGGEFVVSDKRVAFKVGQKVRANDGPFRGFDGIVQKSEKDRVSVLIRFFGGERPVEFEGNQVEAA